MLKSITCCGEIRKAKTNQPLDAVIAQSEIGPLYDKLSRYYDIWGNLTESKARQRALQLAKIRDGSTILEVAVGTGLAFEQIVRQNPNGTNIGIDLSHGMLAKAHQRLSKTDSTNFILSHGSAARLEIAKNSIDLLVNNYMFDLIPFDQMDSMLLEFKRVLKPTGKLVMVNMAADGGFNTSIFAKIYRAFPKLMGGCRGVVLHDRLLQHGFKVQSREYVRQMLFTSEIISALKP